MKYRLLIAISLFVSSFASSQTSSLKGAVTTTDGQPAPSVTVAIKALKLTTVTDEDGHYVLINIKPGTHTVTFSHTGLETQEQTAKFEAGKTTELTFSLKQTAKQLDEVTVRTDKTTIKKPVSIGKADLAPLDNPQSTGLVSNTVIRDQQVMRLGDVVKNVSGVSLTQQRQGVAETFSARGYSIGIGGGTGSIFKNGITTNTAGFPEASTLESVEVLKGSSALLYGNTSAGVIINMVTKKPKFNWGGEVAMTAGSADLYKPMVDIYGPLSKNLAFRVVSTYEHSRSFRDVVHTERTYVNPSLLYKLGKKTTILLQGDYLDANFTPDNGIGVLNQNMNAVIPASRTRFINTPWAYYQSKTASGSLVIDHNFNDTWKLNVIAAGQSVKISSFGTSVPSAIDSFGNWNRTLSRARSSEGNQTAQVNLLGKFKTASVSHQFLGGTDYVGIKTKSDAFRITSSAGVVGTAYDKINILNPNMYVARTDMPNTTDTGRTESPSYRIGLYVQDLISITSKLKVLAGLRWSYLETKATTTYNYVKNTQVNGDKASYNALSPKGAIIYQPTENMSVYVSYANSFTANTGTDIYNNPLKPSTIDDYEMGWKNVFFKGKLAANLSIYRIQNSNLAQQALFLIDGSPNTNTNIKELTGQTTSDGFDVDFSGTLSKNLYFMAGYAYNNARYTNSTGAKGSVVEGEKLINNPSQTANGTVFYTFTQKGLHGLKVGVSGFYTGTRFGGNQNTVAQTPVYNRQISLSDFTTFDLSAGYTFKKISALVKLSNITNTLNYLVHDRYSINPIAPRQLMATVSYKF
ncbi:TonB-dependent siderophore receptor [Chitinophagaceae bacterium LWZ2-11]